MAEYLRLKAAISASPSFEKTTCILGLHPSGASLGALATFAVS
jgi:hypothetical protein